MQFHEIKERLTGSAVFDIPEAAIDGILERARKAYLSWSGNLGTVEATVAATSVDETKNQLRGASTERSARVRR